MLVNGFAEGFPQHCPVVGAFEETGWNMQCPMSHQWSKQMGNVCSFSVHNEIVDRPVQCHRSDPYSSYVPENVIPQYYQPQIVYHPPRYIQQPLIPSLPCHQNQNQEWDYNSMCYNVNGQPCQYTNVVDLEDFM